MTFGSGDEIQAGHNALGFQLLLAHQLLEPIPREVRSRPDVRKTTERAYEAQFPADSAKIALALRAIVPIEFSVGVRE